MTTGSVAINAEDDGKILDELSKEEKRKKAGVLISLFAFAHSAIAFTLANTAIGDTFALTAMTFWMIQKIGKIYNCNDINPWKIMGKVFGFCAGTYIGGKLLFWIPGIGNLANATATFIVTQTIGWTCVFLMESFQKNGKLDEISDNQWNEIMSKSKELGESETLKNEEMLKKMTKEEKKRFRELNDKIRCKELSKEEEKMLFEEINRLRDDILKR